MNPMITSDELRMAFIAWREERAKYMGYLVVWEEVAK
jgi:hypothetical protein